jgi:hypothetical protein
LLCEPNCTLGCCAVDDSCSVVGSNDACIGGTVRGAVFECAENTCTTSSGACCLAEGGCEDRNVLDCTAADTTFEPDVPCSEDPCAE